SLEPDVKAAKDKLQSLVDDPTSTNDTLNAAKTALDDALTKAKSDRDQTISDGDTTEDSIKDKPLAKNPAVAQAITDYDNAKKNAGDDKGTTEQISTAAAKLKSAIGDASQAIIDAKTTLGKTAPYSLEPDVQEAKDKLQKLVAEPSSSNQAIDDANNALGDALKQAKTDRDQAIDNGDTSENSVKDQPLAQNPAVAQAITDYDNAKKNAGDDKGTTEQIQNTADKLKAAIDKSEKVIGDANALLGKTAPYSLEPDVQAAKDKLKKLIDNPASGNEDINAAKTALDDALTKAKTDRDQTISDGDTTENNIKDQPVAKNPAVAQAITDYDNAKKNASDDKGTTEQIKTAADKLKTAIGDAGKVINDANTALGKTAPYSLEPDVEAAKNALQKLVDEPSSSNEDISKATTALDDALTAAKKTREDVINNGDAVVAKIGPDIVANPDIIRALKGYDDAKTNAAKDTGTTSAIDEAAKALRATIDRVNKVRDEAGRLITSAATAPYSYEPDVAIAKSQLTQLLDDPTISTADLQRGIDELQIAVIVAQVERKKATDDGTAAITAAHDAGVADNPDVAAAIADYNALVARAATDDPNALTEDIAQAVARIRAAIVTATTESELPDTFGGSNTEDGESAPIQNKLPATGGKGVSANSLPETGGTSTNTKLPQLAAKPVTKAALPQTGDKVDKKASVLGLLGIALTSLFALMLHRRREDD
ncbi:LPXTG cell wall anchor domain-containing protein, partial [Lacticaseibacillus zhaodongensis]|uniref:LPXTG cell wall anchor domain-containing protein n=1 Tax=Lacticaseibacillus zhaodongensis TaxID=2668065 RepID=UPI0012D317B5